MESPPSDLQSIFSSSAEISLYQKYRHRCVVCLQRLPVPGILCTRVIDTPLHVSTAIEEGLVAAEYSPASEANGVLSESIPLTYQRRNCSLRCNRVSHLPSSLFYHQSRRIFASAPCIALYPAVHLSNSRIGSKTIARGKLVLRIPGFGLSWCTVTFTFRYFACLGIGLQEPPSTRCPTQSPSNRTSGYSPW